MNTENYYNLSALINFATKLNYDKVKWVGRCDYEENNLEGHSSHCMGELVK
jgi:hypothetical protein